ncbi:TadE/TadG family type IV pilus assembly protein [Methyloterricola oryzae]|uniref:TadE/TadG family type IV pilus assembly protein n=1 Tax=Methyloterricola oryzae TaxID=1495050 RepID=UPI0005EBCEBB|nr:TadE family protein [Methyloterricola oryzae]
MKRQRGLHTVEFALVGGLFFVLLFGAIEFGRALFVWNTLSEATRRGARLAAVCPLNHPSIANVTVFNAPASSGDSALLHGLDTGNVVTEYLDEGGAVTGVPDDIRFVRVRITGYRHLLLIPYFNLTLNAPEFATTLPRESLGAVPDAGGGSSQCP